MRRQLCGITEVLAEEKGSGGDGFVAEGFAQAIGQGRPPICSAGKHANEPCAIMSLSQQLVEPLGALEMLSSATN